MPPTLFKLYSETVMDEALSDLDWGVTSNGRLITNIRDADDPVLEAPSELELQKIVNGEINIY